MSGPPCGHDPRQPEACHLCWLAEFDSRYQKKWELPVGIKNGKVIPPRPGGNHTVSQTLLQPAAKPCEYVGDQLTGQAVVNLGLSPLRMWTYCDHSEKPLGNVVCQCQGCGPACRGYKEGEE